MESKQTLSQRLFLFLHFAVFFLIVISPLIFSKKLQLKYCHIIAYFLYATIVTWIIAGQCPLNNVQNTTEYGTITTFLLCTGVDATPYHKTIDFIARYLVFTILLYYSPSQNFTISCVVLLIFYHINRYLKNKPIIRDVIKELSR